MRAIEFSANAIAFASVSSNPFHFIRLTDPDAEASLNRGATEKHHSLVGWSPLVSAQGIARSANKGAPISTKGSPQGKWLGSMLMTISLVDTTCAPRSTKPTVDSVLDSLPTEELIKEEELKFTQVARGHFELEAGDWETNETSCSSYLGFSYQCFIWHRIGITITITTKPNQTEMLVWGMQDKKQFDLIYSPSQRHTRTHNYMDHEILFYKPELSRLACETSGFMGSKQRRGSETRVEKILAFNKQTNWPNLDACLTRRRSPLLSLFSLQSRASKFNPCVCVCLSNMNL